MRTRLKLISQEGKALVQWADADLEEKIGMMQESQTPDDTLSKSKLKTMAVTMLNELKKPAESLNVTALGISSVYAGMAVYISIPDINIGRTFYVDADTHTWEGDYHTMKLTLNFATDLESINENGETEVDKTSEKSATKAAKQAIKEAAAALKKKKAAESRVIKAGKRAEKAVITQSAKAQTENEKAKEALVAAKELMNIAQSTITTNADFAAKQAEASARRASAAAAGAEQYL